MALGVNTVSFTFADPAPDKAGASYALVLSRDGNGSIAWSSLPDACDGRCFATQNSTEPPNLATTATWSSPRSCRCDLPQASRDNQQHSHDATPEESQD